MVTSAKYRSNFEGFRRLWWRLQISEKFSSETITPHPHPPNTKQTFYNFYVNKCWQVMEIYLVHVYNDDFFSQISIRYIIHFNAMVLIGIAPLFKHRLKLFPEGLSRNVSKCYSTRTQWIHVSVLLYWFLFFLQISIGYIIHFNAMVLIGIAPLFKHRLKLFPEGLSRDVSKCYSTRTQWISVLLYSWFLFFE